MNVMRRVLSVLLISAMLGSVIPESALAAEMVDGQLLDETDLSPGELTEIQNTDVVLSDASEQGDSETYDSEQEVVPEKISQLPEENGSEETAKEELIESEELPDDSVPDMDRTKDIKEILEVTDSVMNTENIEVIQVPEDMTDVVVSDVWVNPLYEDVVSESDLLVSEENEIELFSEPEYFDSIEAVGEVLRDGMKDRETSVTLYHQFSGRFDISIARNEIFKEALKHTGNPKEGDYLKWQYAGCRVTASYRTEEEVNYVTWNFTITYYTDSEQEAELDARIGTLKEEWNWNGESDYEKICVIYNYICQNITYDYENLYDDDHKLKYTAYGALINGTAVCQGYAVLLYRLALEAGIDCRLIPGIGNGESHGWNIIRLDDLYYNLDATWDAPLVQTDESYQYFLKSEDNFKDHIRSEQYDTCEFHAAYPMSGRNYQTSVQNPRLVGDSSMHGGQKVTYDCVWYGSYPQTEVKHGTELYEQLENAQNWDADNNVQISGQKYHRENGKYFIWEPIKWRVLNVDEGGRTVLHADSILNSKGYDSGNTRISWYDSELRTWLNRSFADQIFSEEEKQQLVAENRKYVFVGDSYLDGYSADGTVSSWGDLVEGYLSLPETVSYHKGGTGFSYGIKFENLLPENVDESVTDVIVIGGYNDKYYSEKIKESVKSFAEKCRTIYPNAYIHIGMAGYDTDSERFDRDSILNTYVKAAVENGCSYIWGMEDALCDEYMSSDGYHPNQEGQKALAKALAAYLSDAVSLPTISQMYGTQAAVENGFSVELSRMDEARRRKATDYALSGGIQSVEGQYGTDWWLRSPGRGSGYSFIYDMGDVCRAGYRSAEKILGICPVIILNLYSSGSWSYAGTFCTAQASDGRDDQSISRKNGICEDSSGNYYYYIDGLIDDAMTGLVFDKNVHYYVENGKVDDKRTGLVKDKNGKLYYVKNGVVDAAYTGFVQHTDKNWYYVVNGKVDVSYTGLAKHTDNKWYYADKGVINWSYTGVAVNTYNHWYCVKNGMYDSTPNGLVCYSGIWYYIRYGEWIKDYQGYIQHTDKKWYYVKNGKIDFSFTGLAKHTDNKWYYADKGVIDWNYTGLAKNTYGSWYYVKKGLFDASFNGLVYYNGTWYALQNGYLDWNYTSLVQHTDGTWYYVEKGKINWNYTGLVQHYGTWYYVQGGKLNWNYTGLTYYYGILYYVQGGILNWNHIGLVQHTDKNWYYVQKGKVNANYTSLVQHTDGNWYYVEKGKINWNYTGLVQYYGTWYYVQGGKLNWNYTGLTYYYGTWYYVQGGILNWNYTGLVQRTDQNWYYVQKGKIVWGYTSLVQHTDKNWYYVENAKINWNYTGLVQYYGTWYYVQGGKLNWNYTGLTYYYGTWYYVQGGRLNWNYTGLVQHTDQNWYYVQKGKIVWGYTSLVQHTDQNWYYVENAKINWDYSGLVEYYGTWYYVQGGKLDWNYNGSGYYQGIPYTVKNGRATFSECFQIKKCRASDYTGTQIELAISASESGFNFSNKGSYYILLMDSSGTVIEKAVSASVVKSGEWQFNAILTSEDEFRDIAMGQYAIGIKNGDSYSRISDCSIIENPEIMATMTKDYLGYYTSSKISSKKGIQGVSGAYTEDLGVQHVLLNIDLAQMVSVSPKEGYVTYNYKGTTYYFQDMIALEQTLRYLNGWDNDNPYGWHSRSVTVVLLMSWKDELSYLIHPSARQKGAASYYALNMNEEKARKTFEALFCYMGEKLGGNKSRVSNWTLGNEVNSCNEWNYSGNMSLAENVSNYAQAFQLLYQGVKRTASTSRVFISLDHCWNAADAGYSGKAFLDEFASYMDRTAPKMQWNVNYHPYSQPLTKSNFWSDSSNTSASVGTSYISMNNMQVLTDYLGIIEEKYNKEDNSIRVILGELGYTARINYTSEEELQAAALGYGYYIALFNERVDAYIVRAYIDDPTEMSMGLYLGMHDSTEHEKKSYDVYKHLDTDQSLDYMNQFLDVIGIQKWSDTIKGFDAARLPAVDF